MEAVCRELVAILAEPPDDEAVSAALYLAMDCISFASGDQQEEHRAAFVTYGFAEALFATVFPPQNRYRFLAVYAIGKIRMPGGAELLRRAFDSYYETDPLLLESILGESGWLQSPYVESMVERAMASDRFLTRWAILKIHGFTLPECLEHLTNDEHPLVFAEANYQWCLRAMEEATRGLPKVERKQRMKEVRQTAPTLTFADLQIRFPNYLHRLGIKDYTLDLLTWYVYNYSDLHGKGVANEPGA